MYRHNVILGILMAVFLVTLTAAKLPAKELTYRLKWLYNASVAGDMYAEEKGYFTKAGLSVTIKEGGPGKNAIKELELGQADFGVASADQVIIALEKGAQVVVLFQIFQTNPMQWIYRSTLPEITQIEQLKGKSIGITFGGNDESIMNTLFAMGGLTNKDVDIHSARFDFSPFLTKKVQIWPVYRNSQGVILQKRLQAEGELVRFFNPADFGVNFVANSVITSKKMMDQQPELVDAFRTALLSAWEDAMDKSNEQEAIRVIARRDKGNDTEMIKLQLDATRELVSSDQFGSIHSGDWIQTEKIMLKEGQISSPVGVEKWLYR